MNNLLLNTKGIDVSIQGIQRYLYESLSQRWSGDIEGYGRVYKNIDSTDRVFPQWYNSSTEDYKDVYYDDSKSAVFSFLVSDDDSTNDEFVFTSKVKCVFGIDLSKVFDSNKRLDSEAQRDVVEFLRNSDFNTIKITSIQKTIESVYNGYNIDQIKLSGNIQPKHVFSVNFDLQYYLTDKCN